MKARFVLLGALAIACGGKSEKNAAGDSGSSTGGSSSGGSGASDSGAGGSDTGTGGNDDIIIDPNATGGAADSPDAVGGTAGAASCIPGGFWERLGEEYAPNLVCYPSLCDGEPQVSVIFNDSGQPVEFPSVSDQTEARLIEAFANESWPCLAGESTGFCCTGN